MTARLEVLLRRRTRPADDPRCASLTLSSDTQARTARRGEVELKLMPTEYKLLDYMMRNRRQC